MYIAKRFRFKKKWPLGGMLSQKDILRFREDHLLPALSVSHRPEGLKIVKGTGQYLHDSAGRVFVDCGLWTGGF